MLKHTDFFCLYTLQNLDMKRLLLLPLIAFIGQSVCSQTLSDTTLTLQNVDVRGKRFAGLSGGEVKRLQVEGNLSSATGTAADAFRQLPSVVTDIEGGITFRGSNKPGMLVNGIPYGLMEEYSGDVLIQLPALFFNRIEMTSFPPIELVPEGDAGILNLSSASYSRGDSPLQLTVGAGLDERYNAGAIVNLHPGKFHIVGKYNYRREYRERRFRKTTTTPKNRTEMNNNAASRPDVHLADLAVGYDLTPADRLTAYGLYYRMDYNRYGAINNRVYNPKGDLMKYVLRHRYNDQLQDAYAAEARWSHSFSNPASLLDVVFNYNNFAYTEDNDFKNENTETGKIAGEDNLFIRQKKDNYYWSAAYRTVFADSWYFKAGYIGRMKKESYSTEANDLKENSWAPNAQKSYGYSFDRLTNLLYASVEKQWGDISAEAGLQGEVSTQQVSSQSESDHTRLHLYPRAKFSYRTGESGQFSLGYLQRVIRPYGADLSDYTDQSDATHIRRGNPDLKDELVHTFDLSYQFAGANYRVSLGLYYRNKANRIMELAYNEGEQTIWQKQNIGTSQAVGFELSGSWSPVRILSIGLSGNVYRDEIAGVVAGFTGKRSLVCWDAKGDINIHLTATTELQIDGFYISDQLTPQGEIKSRYSVNAGLSQYFMHRKLRANLSINNIFDSLGETTIIDTEALKMEQVRNRDARVAWLTLTYSL